MEKNKEQLELEKMRHSCEHVLHQAVTDLFPGLKRAMGPATDEGFYHDFDYDGKVSEEDFPRIEKRMQELIDKDSPIVREEISIEDAKKLFKDNPYKLDWVRIIEEKGEKATVYWNGKPREEGSDVDLCKGPHVESTGKIGPFKLLKIAGAYWHGDEKNKMLQRIYGTAFPTQKELDDYLNMIEEAKKRDHKKLGKELGLFTFSELVGAGLPLWTPKGTLLRNILDNFVWELRQAKGYQKVTIPHITKKDLYETSGHWAKFSNDLFKITTREGHEFAMKPMNCPHHTQIFACEPRSYRDLPHRYAETTMVYRDEQTGELSGLSRVRCITQDDAHCFCRESQLKDEFYAIWDIIETFYAKCGFPELKIRLSLSDPEHMEKYLGTREDWDKFEEQLRGFIRDRGAEFTEAAGEAAFYGPKIDFMAKDSLGREWQVATIQADRNMPKNFKLFCTNEDGKEEQIVMIHAAIMGSIERFLSILIEHHAGAFPFWMAPVQAKILPISDKFMDYANKVAEELKSAGIRVQIDISAEGLGKKIRNAEMEKIPYMIVVGEKEQEAGTIAVRDYATKKQEVMKVEEFLKKVK
ncbi:MAG: threonyl-tRNA synthetase, threonyl-tRNA synthetase [Candidatus Peregrinibacteria bacterium GW2011_GWC2_39_14]|nr:MAG: Threonine-tRNA ligase [Candidatus Peregrinibacteria bacterium GW2011_GWA2_38_36]KKR04989.1 MAG: threonyl-tRNA synthetase, threonyl-tRNA synthetase [Candidatus Peregrinibacteria bacterium GW2011_GWC2_39_14]